MGKTINRLHAAIRSGRPEEVQRLLAAGTDPNGPGAAGTPDGEPALTVAVRLGAGEIGAMLLSAGADPNRPAGSGDRPLHDAAMAGREDLVELLLCRGADPDAPGRDGATALHLAAGGGCDAVCRVLLGGGASAAAVDADGDTPLHWAVADGHSVVVGLLLKSGAAVTFRGLGGRTPLHVAAGSRHADVARVLLAAGADRLTLNLAGFGYSTGGLEVSGQAGGLTVIGGTLDTALAQIGRVPGASNSVTLTGPQVNWRTAGLSVGYDGTGTLNLSGGSLVQTGSLDLGSNAGRGIVSVSGTGTAFTATAAISVGSGGTGDFGVFGGATLNAGTLRVGRGILQIADPASTAVVAGRLEAGSPGQATVAVSNGALLERVMNSRRSRPVEPA